MGASVALIADQVVKHPDDWGTKMRGKPTGSEIHWWWRTELPGWSAHLVKVLDIVGSTMKFRGVELGDVDRDFGPVRDDSTSHYSVNILDLRHVYPLRPSSLEGYVSGSEACYALLLLSSYYRTGIDIHQHYPDATPADPNDNLSMARAADGPKYPVGHGLKSAEALTKELAETNERFAKAMAAAVELFAHLGMKSDPKVSEWAKTWAP